MSAVYQLLVHVGMLTGCDSEAVSAAAASVVEGGVPGTREGVSVMLVEFYGLLQQHELASIVSLQLDAALSEILSK